MLIIALMSLAKEKIDVTLPAARRQGSFHPISHVIRTLRSIMHRQNFVEESGPSIESSFYNFTMLNIPEGHPARECHDTFLLNSGKLLRSHVSAVQARVLESGKYPPPFGVFSIGAAYRRDDDPTHLPMFNQIECFMVDKGITFAHLKGHLDVFLSSFFYPKKPIIRLRPSYFPFTEPSVEVDIRYNDSWLEVLGAGMIRKNILDGCGYTACTGFAFGGGIERLSMIKYGIKNMSHFYENRLDFLSKFNNKYISTRQSKESNSKKFGVLSC